MSSMTMTMFAPRIWGYDLASAEAQIARASGWSRTDLIWEHLMEQACAAWAEDDPARASGLLRRANWVARLSFPRDDLRRAACWINRAMLDTQAGDTVRAEAGLDRAATLWDSQSDTAIGAMQIAPRARSSLFHLRMEARHRETYHGNMRTRFRLIAGETFDTIKALRTGQPAGHRHYARWRGEKPSVFDDTRKVLGACLLIFDG